MTRLVCIIGTDGSGKTALSEALVERLHNRGQRATRVWLGSENFIMSPVRWALKLFWERHRCEKKRGGPKPGLASQRIDYAAEINKKNDLAARYPFAARVYLAMVWFNYWLQLCIKRICNCNAGTIVADRYFFDVVVNAGLSMGWTSEEVVRYAQTRIARIALPEVRVFLRVEPEVSMARKDDVFDIDYLSMRLCYYDAIAKAFGFTVRDGELPITENADWLAEEVTIEAARPYVLYVHSNNVDVGGADKVLALMARHMRDYKRPERGCRVAVALRQPTPVLGSHADAGVPVFLFPFERPQLSRGITGYVHLILRTPKSFWFFWRLFGRERPDIVHVNDLYDFLPALAARIRGIPVVWHIRMIVQNDLLRQAFSSMIYHLADTSIMVSHAVRNHYFPSGCPSDRSLVIYDLGNTNLIEDDRDPAVICDRPDDLPKGGRLVLMIGRIEPWKGQHVFLEAVEQLSRSQRAKTVFALVGEFVHGKEDYEDHICRRATTAGILLLGERSDIPALLRSADISVHASVSPDPFPGVVIESLLSGAATIAAAAGGVVEMIDDRIHGRLCPPGDSIALAAILSNLLDEPQSPRSIFGAKARSRALTLVDSKVVNAAVMSVYSNILLDQNDPKSAT